MPVEKNNGAVVVLLFCGLPGAGKSHLIRCWEEHLQQQQIEQQQTLNENRKSTTNDNRIEDVGHETGSLLGKTDRERRLVVIDYDALQEDLWNQSLVHNKKSEPEIVRGQKSQKDGNAVTEPCPDSSSSMLLLLQSWKTTRAVALDVLWQRLDDAFRKINKNPRNSVQRIVLDDNFYLRSMRKQVYQVCQQFEQQQQQKERSGVDETDTNNIILFGTVWVDTPVSTCLERNQRRRRLQRQHCSLQREQPGQQQTQSRYRLPHPDDTVISNMANQFEFPDPSSSYYWDKVVLHLSYDKNSGEQGGDDDYDCRATEATTKEWVAQLDDMVNSMLQNKIGRLVVAATADDEQASLDRNQTQESIQHFRDKCLRLCVQTIMTQQIQPNSLSGKQVNEIRKQMMKDFQQQQQQLSTFANDSATSPLLLRQWTRDEIVNTFLHHYFDTLQRQGLDDGEQIDEERRAELRDQLLQGTRKVLDHNES